jgi:hypothetical protein
VKGFSDFDELPLALGESLHGRVGRGGKIEPFEKFAGAPLHRRAIEELQAQHAAAREPGKKYIFGDREVREYVQLLVDQRHAAVDGIGRVEGQVPEAVQREGARVGLGTPARMFTRVDLPAPFSPTTPSTSPAESVNDTSRSTLTPENVLPMLAT